MKKAGTISTTRLTRCIDQMYCSGIAITCTLDGKTKKLDKEMVVKLFDAYLNHYRSFATVAEIHGELTWLFQ